MTVTAEDSIEEVEAQVARLFTRFKQVWRESASQVDPELPPAGYRLLAHLARSEGSTAHVLVELFEMDRSVVSRQIGRLEDLGLVTSRPDEKDGRIRRLTVTDAGAAAVRRVREERHARFRAALDGFTPDELAIGARLIRSLTTI